MGIPLSFIVPVFNSGHFLKEAVDSIRAETAGLVEAEIVMVDDCSTDAATLRIIEILAAQPGNRFIRQARNAGPAAARNAGLTAASGDWITFLDSDDVLAPGAIRARLEVLQALPEATWLMGDIYRVTAPGTSKMAISRRSAKAAG